MKKTELVQQMYRAFGEGNIAYILDHVADDVVWEYGPISTDVPWLQRQSGKTGVANFFKSLEQIEFQTFKPTHFFEDSDLVVALVDVEATIRATGKNVTELEEVHLFHFNSDGKIQRFRHRVDTHLQWLANRADG